MEELKLHNEFDKSIIKEIKGTYGWTFQKKDNKQEVVLDVGANFGAYSVYAYLQNVKKIYSYEPEPSNFETTHKEYDSSYAMSDNGMPNTQILTNTSAEEGTHNKPCNHFAQDIGGLGSF